MKALLDLFKQAQRHRQEKRHRQQLHPRAGQMRARQRPDDLGRDARLGEHDPQCDQRKGAQPPHGKQKADQPPPGGVQARRGRRRHRDETGLHFIRGWSVGKWHNRENMEPDEAGQRGSCRALERAGEQTPLHPEEFFLNHEWTWRGSAATEAETRIARMLTDGDNRQESVIIRAIRV